MSGGKNQRALLMEIMVAVLFFGLCATVLLQTFIAARDASRTAGAQSRALTQMQVLCAQLYAAGDAGGVATLLAGEGFRLTDGRWTKAQEGYALCAVLSQEETPSGVLRRVEITAEDGRGVFAQLPCVRYLPGEAQP